MKDKYHQWEKARLGAPRHKNPYLAEDQLSAMASASSARDGVRE